MIRKVRIRQCLKGVFFFPPPLGKTLVLPKSTPHIPYALLSQTLLLLGQFDAELHDKRN